MLDYDPGKRDATLRERGLDFADASQVFSGACLTIRDDRVDYGEARFQTLGRLGDRVVMIVWTPRGEVRRIISMRKCNAVEQDRYEHALDRSR